MYLDGEFADRERADVEAHLRTCCACRSEVEGQQRMQQRLRACASETRAPDALKARLALRVAQERRVETWKRWVRPELVAALAACAGFVAWLSGRQWLAPVLEDAVHHHTHNLPMEVEGSAPQVSQWLADKLDFAVLPPSLGRARLTGARLSHIRDHSAAYLEYGAPNARRVSLFVYDDPAASVEFGLPGRRERVADREVLLANSRGFNVAMWRDREIVYSLVSDLDERDILAMLRERGDVDGSEFSESMPWSQPTQRTSTLMSPAYSSIMTAGFTPAFADAP